MAKLLLSQKADVNATDAQRVTLMQAALAGHKDIVELLTANEANVSAVILAPNGRILTALTLADSAGHKDIADFLRKHGAK